MTPVAALLRRFAALSPRVRAGTIALAIAVVLVTIAGTLLAHPARTPLFATPLHPEQVAEVEAQLAAWNVPFLPSSDNVTVDASRRSDLLLRLSLASVPHAHVETSVDAFSNVGVLTPQSVIDQQARSGLAGDIELALRGIDGVDDARVIIAPAQSAEFADERARPATASVRVRLHPGVTLSRAAVAGMRRFVAASVPGLDASRVTILDDRGIALGSDPAANDDAAGLERSLQSALDAALGAGAAIARVHLEYTTQSSDEKVTRRDVLAGPPLDSQTSDEQYSGDGKRYAKRSAQSQRGTQTRERTIHAEAGAVARISAAVLLDQTRGLDLAVVRELAAATIGIDPRRGDTLIVAAVPFHRTRRTTNAFTTLAFGVVAPLLPLLAVLGAAALAIKSALPHLRALLERAVERDAIAQTTRSVAGYEPARVRRALAGEPPHAAAAIISALPAATAAAVLELYPAHEREAIVKRMQRAHAPVVPGLDEVLGTHA
jgi:flagellar M-ring protein FliF